jgi:hypothetical protein
MWTAIVVLCIAGSDITIDDFNDVCISYKSDVNYETPEACASSIVNVLKTDEMQAMTSLPEYDLEVQTTECTYNEPDNNL